MAYLFTTFLDPDQLQSQAGGPACRHDARARVVSGEELSLAHAVTTNNSQVIIQSRGYDGQAGTRQYTCESVGPSLKMARFTSSTVHNVSINSGAGILVVLCTADFLV